MPVVGTTAPPAAAAAASPSPSGSAAGQDELHTAPATTTTTTSTTNKATQERSTQQREAKVLSWWKTWMIQKLDSLKVLILQETPEEVIQKVVTPLAVGAAAVLLILGPRTILSILLNSAFQVFGVMLGVGLGLGLATHVSDVLTSAHERSTFRAAASGGAASTTTAAGGAASSQQHHPLLQQIQQQSSSMSLLIRQKSAANALALEEPDSYASLMQSAGYSTATLTTPSTAGNVTTTPTSSSTTTTNNNNKSTILRGQVLRSDDSYFTTCYRFRENKALSLFHELFPVVPESVRGVLAQLVEYIMRDFVACWYYKIDPGCIYPPPKQPDDVVSLPWQAFPRRMVYQVGRHRRLPCLDKIYESTVIFAGGLATRVEHVNVFALVLLHWSRILAHTFKVYRTLRKAVVHKLQAHAGNSSGSGSGNSGPTHSSNTVPSPSQTRTPHAPATPSASNVAVTEVSMTKEFLLAGKLHRAVTFGMDVPSVLFADAQGKETGRPTEDSEVGPKAQQRQSQQPPAYTPASSIDDKLLQQRLDVLIEECELDYHRVLAHRMVRALLPRHDFNCQILSTLMVEILAGCVLTPLLQCVSSPEYINSWIVMGLSGGKSSDSPNTQDTEVTTSMERTADTVEGESVEVASVLKPAEIDVRGLEDEGDLLEVDTSVPTTPVSPSVPADPNPGALPPPPASSASSTTTTTAASSADHILTLLGLALIELQRHVDLDEPGRLQSIDWDNAACREAVLKLVLVIEAAMMDGRCSYNKEDTVGDERDIDADEEELVDEDDTINGKDSERAVEVTLPEFESTTLSQILMEMTSDIDAFEERVASENAMAATGKQSRFIDINAEDYTPTSTEQSTLRTLIAAWLHTGQIYRTITVLVQAHTTILAPYYKTQAFLRVPTNANGFVRKLKALEGIEILVDTMAVLAAPRLQEASGHELAALVHKSTIPSPSNSGPSSRDEPTAGPFASFGLSAPSSTPRFLDFNRNESFATSLRSERDRRMQSWEAMTRELDRDGSPLPTICRSRGATAADIALHKEMHHLARIFYGNTNLVGIRDAARRLSSDGGAGTASVSEGSDVTESVPVCLLTVETASQRRRIEIPDDDSSFLLRAQPRPLNAVGVHRDQRNHDQSFKCFAATYEEPAYSSGSEPRGGRYIRRCLVRYYPIDRTASVALQPSDGRRLDQRKNRVSIPSTITVGQSARSAPFLSADFLRERHLCQRWIPKGTTRTQSILASSVMEPTDFNSMPRSGRAIDFVYRLSFFERPMIEIGGKHFTIHDSSSLGTHRADASSLELSDATLSASLLMSGLGDTEKGDDSSEGNKNAIESGPDGYPVIWMKFNRKEEDAPVEVKAYRTSFVRAALLLTAARHEAQLQNLSNCVRNGSAKRATKILTENLLRPTIHLLEHAGSKSRERQSLLLRDLKLGVNHIDREQLRRNGLLSPRYPTVLRELSATVEDAFMAHEVQGVDMNGATGTVFKIRCIGIVDVDAEDSEIEHYPGYISDDGSICRSVQEEWVVYRSFKDFQAFHKHVKMQVSVSESSGTAGSRLVGAATAAFATANGVPGRSRQRELLIPSLAQASKSGALGVTKKSNQKRKEALDVYLKHFLSSCHLLSRSSELLLFLGATFPLPHDLRPGCVLAGIGDPFGRTEMKRIVMTTKTERLPGTPSRSGDDPISEVDPLTQRTSRAASSTSILSSGSQDEDVVEDSEGRDSSRKSRKINMIPSIANKIEKIPLSHFRNRIFELIRYLFGFENASFVRNRMLAALKTASFAVTSNAEFQKLLYNAHLEQLSADSLSGWIGFAIDLLWPKGEFFVSSPPTPVDQLEDQAKSSKQALHAGFPEQLRAILGNELTRDGLDILHEMLQNRVVMKSVAYMLFDLLWLEVFPEIGDVLECGSVLDILD